MYNKETLTFTFYHYWGDFCQGTFVLDLFFLYKQDINEYYLSKHKKKYVNTGSC